jgi:hypothetical protein
VDVGLAVLVGVEVFVAVGWGVEVLVGAGGANVEQAEDRRRNNMIVNDSLESVFLRCIHPPWNVAVMNSK